jgi:hypothetical protein
MIESRCGRWHRRLVIFEMKCHPPVLLRLRMKIISIIMNDVFDLLPFPSLNSSKMTKRPGREKRFEGKHSHD